LELDPLSLIINTDAGETYYWAHQPDDALLRVRKALELDPNFAQAHLVLGKVYEQKKEFPAALREFERAGKLFDGGSNGPMFRAHALALSGELDDALRIARQLEHDSTHQYVPSVGFAFIYCALAAPDKAMTWLDRAYRSEATELTSLAPNRFSTAAARTRGFKI
jgi:tetratricopeptide (TPR) repeat protein